MSAKSVGDGYLRPELDAIPLALITPAFTFFSISFAASCGVSSSSLMPLGSKVGFGYWSFMRSIASTRMLAIATLRKGLWSAGITNHGAYFLLVLLRIAS